MLSWSNQQKDEVYLEGKVGDRKRKMCILSSYSICVLDHFKHYNWRIIGTLVARIWSVFLLGIMRRALGTSIDCYLRSCMMCVEIIWIQAIIEGEKASKFPIRRWMIVGDLGTWDGSSCSLTFRSTCHLPTDSAKMMQKLRSFKFFLLVRNLVRIYLSLRWWGYSMKSQEKIIEHHDLRGKPFDMCQKEKTMGGERIYYLIKIVQLEE